MGDGCLNTGVSLLLLLCVKKCEDAINILYTNFTNALLETDNKELSLT